MGEKDDGFLGLSLSLGLGFSEASRNQTTPLRSFMHSSSSSSPLPFMLPHTPSNDRNGIREIDVNVPAATTRTDHYNNNGDEELMVSSPNSTVSSVSGKRCERDLDNEAERAASSSFEDDEGGGGADGDAAKKKLRLSKEQAAVLEETFKDHHTLNPKQKMALANQLNLRPRQVEVWFQNRRARTKLKQTELDCEYLKRCCDTLTEENKRLQKEVNELRALKLSPHFYMNTSPPTTLTMCPQCERVNVAPSSEPSPATTSLSLAPAPTPTSRQLRPGIAHSQRPVPSNPWATLIPRQTLDLHRPRS